jgi:hypothetical protein
MNYSVWEYVIAIFHVDQRHSLANDANPGTADAPFLTMSHAVAQLHAGDVLRVFPGIYREHIEITRSGAADARIVLESVEPLGAIITGADIVTGWVADGENPRIWKKHGLRIELAKDLHYGLLEGRCEQVFVDGHLLKQVLYRPLMQPGTFYHDEAGATLYIYPSTFTGELRQGNVEVESGWIVGGGTHEIDRDTEEQAWPFILRPFRPEEHTIEVTMRGEVFSAGYENEPDPAQSRAIDYVTLRGFHFRYCGVLPQHPMVYFNGSGNLVENCLMEWSNARALDIHGSQSILRNSILRYNGQMGLSAYGANQLIEDVDLLYNNYKHSGYYVGENGGCKIVFSRNCVMRRVRAIGNDGAGIWFDIDNYDAVIEQCWCEGNSGSGIMYEISWGAIVRNNFCINNGILYGKDTRLNTLANATGAVEPIYGQGILIQISSDCQVYNNTCIGNRRLGIEFRHHPYIGAEANGERKYHLRNNVALNNILVNNAFEQVVVSPPPAIKSRAGEVGGNAVDYNLYHRDDVLLQYQGNLPAYARSGKLFMAGNAALEEWRAYTGFDMHSIQWDPYFLAPAEKNYRLDEQSPAIGRGKPIDGLTTDYYGRPRPQGSAPTIGAVEYDPDDATRNCLPYAKSR